MPIYNQSSITDGQTWRRAKTITIDNGINRSPSIRFFEEDIVNLPSGDVFSKDPETDFIFDVFTPDKATTSFTLRNPETEEYTEQTATYQDVYILLHSLYYHLAQERDIRVARGPSPFVSWVWSDTNNQWEAPVPMPDDGKEYYWEEPTGTWVEHPVQPQV